MTKLNDPLGQAFIEFFESQGVKFVDAETGEEINVKENKWDTHTTKDI